MLSKLIKYDIRSTWRDFTGVYMAILLGVILVPLLLNNVNNQIVSMFAGFIATSIVIATIVIMINHVCRICVCLHYLLFYYKIAISENSSQLKSRNGLIGRVIIDSGGDDMEQWEQVNAVQNMQNYIQQHLFEPITLKELARNAGYSPFYSAKLFKEHTGKAPFEYIRTLRLTQAALKLRDEKVKVLDVAMDFVFDSHEGFTRAFSKEFGITPYKYSKNPPPIQLFMPTPILDQYRFFQRGGFLREIEEGKLVPGTVFVQVVERPGRKLILKRGRTARDYFEYCEEVNCDIWGLLCSVKEALYEPIGLWLPDPFRPIGSPKARGWRRASGRGGPRCADGRRRTGGRGSSPATPGCCHPARRPRCSCADPGGWS